MIKIRIFAYFYRIFFYIILRAVRKVIIVKNGLPNLYIYMSFHLFIKLQRLIVVTGVSKLYEKCILCGIHIHFAQFFKQGRLQKRADIVLLIIHHSKYRVKCVKYHEQPYHYRYKSTPDCFMLRALLIKIQLYWDSKEVPFSYILHKFFSKINFLIP